MLFRSLFGGGSGRYVFGGRCGGFRCFGIGCGTDGSLILELAEDTLADAFDLFQILNRFEITVFLTVVGNGLRGLTPTIGAN